MAEPVYVELPTPTQPRELRYTRAERREFERMFRNRGLSGMQQLIDDLCIPHQMVDGKRVLTGGGDIEVQEALIWLGLRWNKGISLQLVGEWLEGAALESPSRPTLVFVLQAVKAVMESGVLGFVYRATVETVEEGEGKAQPEVA